MTSIHKLPHHSFIIVILSLQLVLQFSGGFKGITNPGSTEMKHFEGFYVPSCDTIVEVYPDIKEGNKYVSDDEYHYTPKSDLIPVDPSPKVSKPVDEDASELSDIVDDFVDIRIDDTYMSNPPDDGYASADESKVDATSQYTSSVNGYYGPYSILEPNFPDELFNGDQLNFRRCTAWCGRFCLGQIIRSPFVDQCLQVTEALNDVIVEGVYICCCNPGFLPLS